MAPVLLKLFTVSHSLLMIEPVSVTGSNRVAAPKWLRSEYETKLGTSSLPVV